MTLWIIEDDPGCRFVYSDVLATMYDLVFFDSLESFRQEWRDRLHEQTPRLLIADLRLVDGLFLDFLQDEASFSSVMPFLVVSVLDDMAIFDQCRERGALDYLTKPFNRNELIFKVRYNIEQHANKSANVNKLCDLDSIEMVARVDGVCSERLTLKEYQILAMFNERQDNQLTRDEILGALWSGFRVCPQTLNVHLKNLRQKIGPINLQIDYVKGRYILSSSSLSKAV